MYLDFEMPMLIASMTVATARCDARFRAVRIRDRGAGIRTAGELSNRLRICNRRVVGIITKRGHPQWSTITLFGPLERQIGAIHGGRDRPRLNRVGHVGYNGTRVSSLSRATV